MKETVSSGSFATAFVGAILSCNLWATALPDPVDGVVTVDISVATTYDTALSASATKLVKKGTGEAKLTVTSTFSGTVEVHGGILSITDYKALGTGVVEVKDTATFSLKGRCATSQAEKLFPNKVKIAGTGYNNTGALRFEGVQATGQTDCNDAAITDLELTGDATISGSLRWGFRGGIVRLNGYKLTQAGTTGFMFNDMTLTPGTFRLAAGTLYHQSGVSCKNAACTTVVTNETTLQIAGGTYYAYGFTTPFTGAVEYESGAFSSAEGVAVSQDSPTSPRNVFAGRLKLNPPTASTAMKITTSSAKCPLRFLGEIDLGSKGYLVHSGTGPLVLGGNMSGGTADNGGFQFASQEMVLTGNVTRTTTGIFARYTSVTKPGRLHLTEGTLSTGCLRIGNNGDRGVMRVSGGTYTDTGTPIIGQNGGPKNSVQQTGYGAMAVDGGTVDFKSRVYVAAMNDVQGLFLQHAGLVKSADEFRLGGGYSTSHTGAKRGVMCLTGGTFDGAGTTSPTNNPFRFGMGGLVRNDDKSGNSARTELTVTGADAVFKTHAFLVGNKDAPTTNIVNVADGAVFQASRFYRLAWPAGSKFLVHANGGIFKPSFGHSWFAGYHGSDSNIWNKAPDRFTVYEKGVVFDLTDCLKGGGNGTTMDVEVNFSFRAPTGKGVVGVTLSDAVKALDYEHPVPIDIVGAGEGATAYAEVDFATRKISVRVTSPGNDYDDNTKAYVYSPDGKSRYECACTMASFAAGPLVKRGPQELKVFGTNTCAGAVIEGGAIRFGTLEAFPAGESLAVKNGGVAYLTGSVVAGDLSGQGAVRANSGAASLTVTNELKVTLADLLATPSKGGVTATLPVTLGNAVKVTVTDPENFAAYREAKSVAFLTVDGGAALAGPDPVLELPAEEAGRWKVMRVGNTLRFGPSRGMVLVFR